MTTEKLTKEKNQSSQIKSIPYMQGCGKYMGYRHTSGVKAWCGDDIVTKIIYCKRCKIKLDKLIEDKTKQLKGIFDTMRIKSDRFFNKCKKCNEVYEETIAYRRGMIRQTKHIKAEVEKIIDEIPKHSSNAFIDGDDNYGVMDEDKKGDWVSTKELKTRLGI